MIDHSISIRKQNLCLMAFETNIKNYSAENNTLLFSNFELVDFWPSFEIQERKGERTSEYYLNQQFALRISEVRVLSLFPCASEKVFLQKNSQNIDLSLEKVMLNHSNFDIGPLESFNFLVSLTPKEKVLILQDSDTIKLEILAYVRGPMR